MSKELNNSLKVVLDITYLRVIKSKLHAEVYLDTTSVNCSPSQDEKLTDTDMLKDWMQKSSALLIEEHCPVSNRYMVNVTIYYNNTFKVIHYSFGDLAKDYWNRIVDSFISKRQ